ncbi:MAG TPA: M20/M25/M40 family metallo-hydrolase [Armatimonadota bacterium]|jgi:acetylornithine deacetylase
MSDVISLLQSLVRIPSVNPSSAGPQELGGEARLVDFLEDWLRAAGLQTTRQPVAPGRENLLALYPGSAPRALLLEAHLDTVGTAGYHGDPFSGAREGGRVLGRGACDCKASMAAACCAARRVAQERLAGGVLLAFTVDEEHLFAGINTLVAAPLPLPVAGAVVGEPTGLDVINRHGGAVRLWLTVHGQAAHSAYPQYGRNAIFAAAHLITALEHHHLELQAGADPEQGVRTCSVTLVQGGDVINMIPDWCRVGVDRRLRPDEQPAQVLEQLREVAQRAVAQGFPWELETILLDPPLPPATPAPLAELCRQAVQAVRGSAQMRGVNYSTDASNLAQIGMEAVVLGPGDIAQAHTAEEWVEVAEVEQAEEIYYRIVREVGEG